MKDISKYVKEKKEKENRTTEDIVSEYEHALKELKYSQQKLKEIIKKFKYKKITKNKNNIFKIFNKIDISSKYCCYNNLDKIDKIPKKDIAIVTGFGPTNSPTAGTLASIFRAIKLQKETGIYTHIIISEFSALNSRQKPLDELLKNSERFINFIKKVGFSESNGEIRTHNYHDHSRTVSIVSSVLTISDLIKNQEVTKDTYDRLGISGNDFSKMISRVYTISDIILPIIRDKKKAVIVPVGLEEHHHPLLAGEVIERLKKKTGGVSLLLNKDAIISALFGKIISGFYPYVKMSKSIPDSSVNIGDDENVIYKKIVESKKKDDKVILEMIQLASDWDTKKIQKAEEYYKNRVKDYQNWKKIKIEYYNFFIKLKKIWESIPDKKIEDPRKKIFIKK